MFCCILKSAFLSSSYFRIEMKYGEKEIFYLRRNPTKTLLSAFLSTTNCRNNKELQNELHDSSKKITIDSFIVKFDYNKEVIVAFEEKGSYNEKNWYLLEDDIAASLIELQYRYPQTMLK